LHNGVCIEKEILNYANAFLGHFINGYHASGDTVPFGGMKHSGVGREKGLAALDAYYEIKSVTVTL
jgi:acyl-CoA reductase-like NAD-dependent aldehyde dehydrogenase